MKMGRKILSVLLALVLVAGWLPVTVSAADGDAAYPVEGGNIYFDTETGTITAYDGSATAVNIPAEINGVAVTNIGDWAFQSCNSLKSVTISEGVISIGWYAFNGCDSLVSIEMPSSVTTIDEYAFSDCRSLTSVTIPASVTTIGNTAFSQCYSLENIEVTGVNTAYCSVDGVLFNKELTELIKYPALKPETSYTIPASVRSIKASAFEGCKSLVSITMPESVTSIGEFAFRSCTSLTSVTIPSSVTTIEKEAFRGCTSLVSVTIPQGVMSIGDYAFFWCTSLTSVTLPSSVTSIGVDAFGSCESLASINVDEANVAYCSDDGVLFSKGKTKLVCYPIAKPASSYAIPEGVTSIDIGGFSGCVLLSSITIPYGVTSIGQSAFSGCTSLVSVTMPSSVTNIGQIAFEDCTSLVSVTMPSSVTSIGGWAFYNCDSLTDVYYGGSEEEWDAISTSNYNDPLLNATIYYNSPMPEPSVPIEPTESEELVAPETTKPVEESTDKPAIVSELAIANTQSVLVDGEQVTFEVYALEDENGGETNYIKLRDLAHILNGTAAQFEVSWDGAVNILSGQTYTPNGSEMSTPFSGDREYAPTDAVTKVDGVVTEFDAICLEDDDGGEYNYYKLRDLGRVLGFDVSWTSEQGIFIETDEPYTED